MPLISGRHGLFAVRSRHPYVTALRFAAAEDNSFSQQADKDKKPQVSRSPKPKSPLRTQAYICYNQPDSMDDESQGCAGRAAFRGPDKRT